LNGEKGNCPVGANFFFFSATFLDEQSGFTPIYFPDFCLVTLYGDLNPDEISK